MENLRKNGLKIFDHASYNHLKRNYFIRWLSNLLTPITKCSQNFCLKTFSRPLAIFHQSSFFSSHLMVFFYSEVTTFLHVNTSTGMNRSFHQSNWASVPWKIEIFTRQNFFREAVCEKNRSPRNNEIHFTLSLHESKKHTFCVFCQLDTSGYNTKTNYSFSFCPQTLPPLNGLSQSVPIVARTTIKMKSLGKNLSLPIIKMRV